MQVKRKEVKDDIVQQQELAAYFNHCNLQKVHLRLALLNTMGVCYKGGNFSTTANFA
jgi:coatomer protein complex subunit alpha (xenin)